MTGTYPQMHRSPVGLATAKSPQAVRPAAQWLSYAMGGLIIPALIWSFIRSVSFDEPVLVRTLLQLGLANFVSWYALGKLRIYARARLLSYVLPVNLVVFGIVFAINALLRQNLSFTLFLTCQFATLAVSYLVTARIRHANPRLKHVFIPHGSIGSELRSRAFEPIVSVHQLETLITTGKITGSLVADLHHDHPPEWERLIAKAALKGIPVYHYRLIEEALTGEVRINHLRENELGSLIPNLPYRTAKRAFDIAFVLVLSPAIIAVSAVVAFAIKLDSGGRVFFVQRRAGFRGEVFSMIKFRTMKERARPETDIARREDAVTKTDDVRITRIGTFLRKTRLDELPQAWNVLVGDMSWIGPRPEALDLADWYETEIPFYAYRHIVRPGITGWAQVNQGHVSDLGSIEKKLRFDFFYVKNLSLWLDILIGLKTLRVITAGIGAK